MKAKQKPGVVFQPQVHHALQRGIQQMVGAIRPTLGPLAGGVAIDHLNNTNPLPEFLDDGGVIARRIIGITNRDDDVGAMLARAMILRQHQRSGDGTATAAVLFEAVFNAGLRYLAAGGNAMQLRRHLEAAIPCLYEALDRMTCKLEGEAALTQMALSLCHEPEMAGLLGEIFDLIGDYGRLEIREGYGRIMHREYVEGSNFDAGVIAKALLPEEAAATVKLENPAIFLCDFQIDDYKDLFPVLRAALDAQVSGLVIVARGLSEKAVSLLVTHNNMNKFKVIAVKLPGLNPTDQTAAMEDLSLLTGATPLLKAAGDVLENIKAAHFGAARRFWADQHGFGLVGGRGNPRKLREHLRLLKTIYAKAEDVEKRSHIQTRIGNLLGGAVTLWVGGFTKPEITTRKALAERTAQALRSAVQEGVVPGGGIALLNCAQLLQDRLRGMQDTDERAALRVLIDALAAPAHTIFRNAGFDPGEIMGQLSFAGVNAAFDVVNERVVDAYAGGILDSAPVIKACLRNAITTAALALTIDSVVHLARPEMVGNPE